MKNLLPLFLGVLLLVTSCSKEEDEFIDIPSDQQFTVNENVPASTFVGSVLATNVTSGSVLSYEIITSGVPFGINRESGELFVADGAAIDFESEQKYTFTVKVFNDITTATAEVTVVINDISETNRSDDEKLRLTSYFQYLALREDDETPQEGTTKWLETMTVFMSGNFSFEDREIITDFIGFINTLFTDEFSLELVNSLDQANTEVYFDTKEGLEERRPDFVGAVNNNNAGKAQISFFDSGEIRASKVWIRTDLGDRSATIKHEFLHAIGLGHSESQSSILFPVVSGALDLSDDDITTVRSLYHPAMPAGADAAEIETILENIL